MKLRLSMIITVIVMVLLFLPACSTQPTSETTANSTVSQKTNTTSSTTISQKTTEQQSQTNWWDSMGTPQYGGEIILAPARFHVCLDSYSATDYGAGSYFMEQLWIPDWTVDREEWSFKGPFIPWEYLHNNLAESWEMTDPTTMVVKIRQGIHWQDKEPVNGREFTAYDIQFHYDRQLGTGSGFTETKSVQYPRLKVIEKVTAIDNYTVVFKFVGPSVASLNEPREQGPQHCFEAPEVIKKYGDSTDWRNAVGTGPWILTDYIDGTSFTFERNSDYWGYDERYPQNQLPYADTFKILYIPDISTRLAALRTGKVDMADEIGFQQSQILKNSNPELKQVNLPFIMSNGMFTRVDKGPFSDINVRKAMQMSIDLESIANGYYKNSVDGIPCGMVNPSYAGYAYVYKDWSQTLKDEYSYNPTRAKELLTQAGYPNGFETSVLVESADDQAVVEIIKSYFAEVGVTLNINVQDAVTARSLASSWQYENYWSRNTGSTAYPPSVVTMSMSDATQNFSRVNDSTFDEKAKELRSATDVDDVKSLVNELDKYTLEQHWTLRLFPINSSNIWQPTLKGYSGESLLRMGNPGGWLWARLWTEK